VLPDGARAGFNIENSVALDIQQEGKTSGPGGGPLEFSAWSSSDSQFSRTLGHYGPPHHAMQTFSAANLKRQRGGDAWPLLAE
jgi:hypothetical protein